MKLHWFFKVLLILLLLTSIWSTFSYGLPRILPHGTISNSDISGFIFQNQSWEGTVKVVGDLWVVPGATINIKPGTQILVSTMGDKFNLDFLPWHRKNGINTKDWYHGVGSGEPFWDEGEKIQVHLGRVNGVGTKEQPIIIRSDTSSPSPYDINVLEISKGILTNAEVSNYRRFEISDDVILRNSKFNNAGECAVCIESGSPTILDNEFEDALRESVWIYRANPRINNNLFANLRGVGIRFDSARFGAPFISNNTFEMPGRLVMDIISGGEREGGVVLLNKISGNTKINLACDSKIKFSENVLPSLIQFVGSGCGDSFVFGPNYWGVAEVRTILSERIIKDKQFEVKIPSILKSPPRNVGRRVQN